MAALPHWEDAGNPWDRLTLGDNVMPGIWEINGGECSRQVDHKKTKDKDKAVIKDLGLLPPRLQARGRIYSAADWEALQRIMPDIHPRKAGGPKFPLKIFHPAAALMGVTTIYVERVRVPEIERGVLTLALDMIEWTEAPKRTRIVKPTPPTDTEIMVAQFRGAGSWKTSTMQPYISKDNYRDVDADFAPLLRDARNPPEQTAKNIDPSAAAPGGGLSL